MNKFWAKAATDLIEKIIKEMKLNQDLTLNEELEKYKREIKEISSLCREGKTYKTMDMGELGRKYFFEMKKLYSQTVTTEKKLYSIMFLDLLDKRKKAPSVLHVLGSIQLIFPQISRALEEEEE